MKKRLTVTKKFTLEMAHVLEEHEGPCNRIHGHSYTLYVTISGPLKKDPGHAADGMIMDFKHLKKIILGRILVEFDHRLLLMSTKANKSLFSSKYSDSVMWMEHNPTCENILLELVDRIARELPLGIKLVRAVLHETATSSAEILFEE